jgi:prepilin-type N-terminal cleavage/methylation domain-containing protein/prepilin-type processing-associated H-X9-DG protein
MGRKNVNTAFTLIELLVVIAIIALLAAILFPVFARARENARRASCLSNLKQMGLAVMQYVQDFDETYPIVAGSGTSAWTWQIYPYIKDHQIYRCSSGTDDSAVFNSAALTSLNAYTQYCMNNSSFGSGVNPYLATYSLSWPTRIAAIPKAAELILFMDAQKSGTTTFWCDVSQKSVDSRHFEGANITFADGHAKWSKPALYAIPGIRGPYWQYWTQK